MFFQKLKSYYTLFLFIIPYIFFLILILWIKNSYAKNTTSSNNHLNQLDHRYYFYKVQKDDNLYEIAKKISVPYRLIQKYSDANIYQGEIIRIPNVKLFSIDNNKSAWFDDSKLKESSFYVKIKKRDTYTRLAKKYHLSIRELKQWNKNKKLYSQEKIVLMGILINLDNSYILKQNKQKSIQSDNSNLIKKIGSIIWPLKGSLKVKYKTIEGIFHDAIQIQSKTRQSNVYVCRSAQVDFVGNISGYGYAVILKDENNIKYLYANLNKTTCHKGEYIKKGSFIGTSFNATIYFGIYYQFKSIDPQVLLSQNE